LHHASNLMTVLRECHRVLKSGGALLVLNETPYSMVGYAQVYLRSAASLLLAILHRTFAEPSIAISKSGILTDPSLGDYCLASFQWDAAFRQVGFSCRTIVSPFPPYKNTQKPNQKLTHFLCHKLGA